MKYKKSGYFSEFYGKGRFLSPWPLFFMIFMTALILFGCAVGGQHQAHTYVPGIYKGVGEGMHGDIIVETVFSASTIVAVTVISHEDTPILSDTAVELIPVAVITAQKTDVDAVTGATVTSDGIKSAIQSTISQALRK